MPTASSPIAFVDEEAISNYRRDGFVHVPGVLTEAEVTRYRGAVQEVYEREQGTGDAEYQKVLKQIFNVWRRHAAVRDLTFSSRLASIATQLAGVPLRLYQDHLLVKAAHNDAATEFHQDAPYFPLATARHILTAWVALVDVPVERGCMTFIPRQHHRRDLRRASVLDAADLFSVAEDLAYEPRVTIPVRAGDVVFHHGYTPHAANANRTDEVRYAHAVVYFDRDAVSTITHTYEVDGDSRVAEQGSRFPDEDFPVLPQ